MVLCQIGMFTNSYTGNMFFLVVVAAYLWLRLARNANADCLYGSNLCQCKKISENKTCLRPFRRSDEELSCVQYQCDTNGYECDCLGSYICPLTGCQVWREDQDTTKNMSSGAPTKVKCFQETSVCVGKPSSEIVAPCEHNSTHCKCSSGGFGGLCLRFLSGSVTNGTCMIQPCGDHGYKCDCMGEQLCKLQKCGRWVTQGTAQSFVNGSTVPCEFEDARSRTVATCPAPVQKLYTG